MMQRWFERIAQKAADPAQAPVLTVAFGDSVTQGVMEHGRLCRAGVYHTRLQRSLEERYGQTTFSTINAGVSGSSVTQALDRLERDVLRHDPDLVLVAFGLNDCLDGPAGEARFEDSLRYICRAVQAETEADLVLLTPPLMARHRHEERIHPAHREVADRIIGAQNEGFLDRYAEIVRCVADEEQTVLADVHDAWRSMIAQGRDTDLLLCNGLNHPDEEGHRIISEVIISSLSLQG
ncbi:MAG: GDSL-type esterase/lipase family protein [Verrucomicrobiota bacterium JB024]|nr:GDSL-type esterase/lipase family protein [Verrucomicrobiota bacterium JB024]